MGRQRREQEPREFATGDPGLVAWLKICRICPSRRRVTGEGRGAKTALHYRNTDLLRAARDEYYRSCYDGKVVERSVGPDLPIPDLSPSKFIEAYRMTLMGMRDLSKGLDLDPKTERMIACE